MRFVRWSLAAAPAASPSAEREQGRAQRVALVRLAGTRAEVYRHHLGASPAPPSAAMRAARLSMIEGGKFGAPFYRAPFILVGDWR